jgi:peptidoglycan/LPS O-acetylase OafA/YrhL
MRLTHRTARKRNLRSRGDLQPGLVQCWSLAAELKFYFWFGLLFACFGRRSLAIAWGTFSFVAWRAHPVLANDFLIAPYAPLFPFGIVAFSWKDRPRWLSLVLVGEALALSFTSPEFKGLEPTGCIVGPARWPAPR